MNRVPGSHGSRSFLIYVSANTQVSHHQLLMINVVYLLNFFRVAWLVQVIAKWQRFLAVTKQLYKWYFPSVRPSVTPLSLCSHHRIIIKFSGVITNDKSEVHAKGQGHRSKVKVTEVKMQLKRFWTVTPILIDIWWWNDAHSLILLRRGALLFFKVIRQISRSHGSKNCRIRPKLGVSGL